MELKTLPADLKAKCPALAKLTPWQENKAAELQESGAVDWAKVIADIEAVWGDAKVLLPIIIGLLGGLVPSQPPSPPPAKKGAAAAATCCDPGHHCRCKETFCKAAHAAHGQICLSEELACCLSCTGCDPCVRDAFLTSICQVFHEVCVMASAGHCLADCCDCCA